MDLKELDKKIKAQQARLKETPIPQCQHQWGTAYDSSGGRKVCVKCGYVTNKPFETLGVGEG